MKCEFFSKLDCGHEPSDARNGAALSRDLRPNSRFENQPKNAYRRGMPGTGMGFSLRVTDGD